jgi:two-component system, NarL family, sensor kinase
LLPSGRFPRFILGSAVSLILLLALDLLFVPDSPANLLIPNGLDLGMVALGAFSCFYLSRRTSGYPRQIWILVGIAFSLQSAAQAITSYYQSFIPSAAQLPWPSDILFFVWPAPIFLLFLPASDDTPSGINWPRVLDFLQVAIVAVTVYLYFFFSPSRWLEQHSMLRQILVLHTSRDLFFAVAFALRSRAALPPWFRSFCLVLALAFSFSALADIAYFVTIGTSVGASSWGDIVWMLPYATVILFAGYWKEPSPDERSPVSPTASHTVASQFLPVIMPLLVIFMSYAIAREHFLLAWLSVTASVLLSAVHLILINQRQRDIAADLLNTEKALRRTEQTLSTAFRSSPDAFSINPFPNGPYFEVNEGFEALTGYSREETIGRTPGELNLWVDLSQRTKALAGLTQTGSIRDVEFRFRKKSGQIRFGNMSASLIDYDGTPCTLVMVRDITDRKEAEEILRSSEERFRSLVQNLQVGIVSYDPQARIVYANDAVLDILGVPLHQITGKTITDLNLVAFYEDGTAIPDHLRPVPLAIESHLAQRNCLIGWRIPKRPDVVWTFLDAVPEFSTTGELSRVIVSFTNLTEQRRAADALRDSEERLRTLVRDLHVAVVLHRPDESIEYANPAAYRMFGVPDGTAVGKFPKDYGVVPVTEDGIDIPPDEQPLTAVLRTRTSIENGVLGLRYPGSPDRIVWVFGNVVPQLDSHGHVSRVISAFSDITEMKNAERAIHSLTSHLLKLQDEERRRLGRELHDGLAQTVLAINLSLAQARQSIRPTDEAAARAIEKARNLTQQVSREIRTLSYLLHPPLLDDLGLVSALKEYTQGFADRSGIDTQLFVLSQFDRLPQSVETALFRIVQESLANVQRHSGSTSAKIRLRQEDSVVTLEVIDFGRGMDVLNGDLHSVEARFGVGIPGMRERMTLLGGTLDIFSDNHGTAVRATIPVTVLSAGEPSTQRTDIGHGHRPGDG